MSAFTKTPSPLALGHIVLTAIFIAVPVLMFAPNIIDAIVVRDRQSLSPGDWVDVSGNPGYGAGGRGTILEITGNKVRYLNEVNGQEVTVPVRLVYEK